MSAAKKAHDRAYLKLDNLYREVSAECAARGLVSWGAGEDLRQIYKARDLLWDLETFVISPKKAIEVSYEMMFRVDTGIQQDAWAEAHSCAVEIGKIAAAARERKQKEREEAARKASRTCLGDLMPAL